MSNEEALCMLSENNDPRKVDQYINNCFEGIASLLFNKNGEIRSAVSLEAEELVFCSSIPTADSQGQVEKWLAKVKSYASLQSMILVHFS